MHKAGSCALAGKVMSSMMICFICKSSSNVRGNARHERRPHFFNKKGRVILESCPVITGISQHLRAEYLEDIGHCPKCLSRADRCPSRHCSLGMDVGLKWYKWHFFPNKRNSTQRILATYLFCAKKVSLGLCQPRSRLEYSWYTNWTDASWPRTGFPSCWGRNWSCIQDSAKTEQWCMPEPSRQIGYPH